MTDAITLHLFGRLLEVPNGRPYTAPALAIGPFFSGGEPEGERKDFVFLLGSGGATWSGLYDMADLSAPDAGTNYTEWQNEEWFSGWDRIAETRNPAEIEAIKNEMLEVFYNDPPWLMMYFQPDFYGVSERIDWQPRRDA